MSGNKAPMPKDAVLRRLQPCLIHFVSMIKDNMHRASYSILVPNNVITCSCPPIDIEMEKMVAMRKARIEHSTAIPNTSMTIQRASYKAVRN